MRTGLELLARLFGLRSDGASLVVSRVLTDLRRPSLENVVLSPLMFEYGVRERLASAKGISSDVVRALNAFRGSANGPGCSLNGVDGERGECGGLSGRGGGGGYL